MNLKIAKTIIHTYVHIRGRKVEGYGEINEDTNEWEDSRNSEIIIYVSRVYSNNFTILKD